MSCDSLHRPIGLAEAARKHFPGEPNPSTVWRWATKGYSDGQGGRIRLEVTYVGRRVMTTPAACGQFIADVTKAKLRQHLIPDGADSSPEPGRESATELRLREAGLL